MCVKIFAPTPKSMSAPPPVTPRVDTNTSLPVKKDVISQDTKADISYGTGQKKTGAAAGKKRGTDQLKIDKINTGNVGSTTGGMNV